MRYKRPYRLIRRRRADGKWVYRYRIWDPVTRRRREFTTGKTTRDGAERYCEDLVARNELVPTPSPVCPYPESLSPVSLSVPSPEVLFGVFAEGWWGPECPYTRSEAERGVKLKRTYRALGAIQLRKYLLPAFSSVPLGQITPKGIEDWRRTLPASPRVRNVALATLSTMLAEAVRLGYLRVNPCARVKPVHQPRKVRQLLSASEMEELLNNDGPGGIWLRHPMEHRIVLLCSRTGLRAGELLGLQLDQITKDAEGYWMQVENSWDRVELTDTKTHETRLVPVALELGERVFGGCPNKGFVFSEDNGKSPINYRRIQTHLNNALRGMGIDDATRKRRGVTLHSLRHKVNTDLRGLVPDSVVRAVIGHVTEEMTDHYTRHSKETLEQVAKVMRGEAS